MPEAWRKLAGGEANGASGSPDLGIKSLEPQRGDGMATRFPAPLPGFMVLCGPDSGGSASLHHRLISIVPSGHSSAGGRCHDRSTFSITITSTMAYQCRQDCLRYGNSALKAAEMRYQPDNRAHQRDH